MTVAARPLDRYPLIRTQDVDEMCAALEQVYNRPRLELPASTSRIDAAINHLPMKRRFSPHAGLRRATDGP